LLIFLFNPLNYSGNLHVPLQALHFGTWWMRVILRNRDCFPVRRWRVCL